MNISTVFLLSQHTPDGHLDLISPHDSKAYRPHVDWINNTKNWYAKDDNAHLNDRAHAQLADQLADHVSSFWTGA